MAEAIMLPFTDRGKVDELENPRHSLQTVTIRQTGLRLCSFPNHPMNSNKPIGQSVRIGHVHLKVADLERALGFYCGVLGFETTVRFGREAAFVSAGGYHHHIG